MRERTVRVPVYVSVRDVIEEAQPSMAQSCDWLTDPIALGIMFFPLETYQRLRELNHGNPSS